MSFILETTDLTLTDPAQAKLSELFAEVDPAVLGVRVYAAGGCGGISFGMSFTDVIDDADAVGEFAGFKVIVDDGTLEYLRGVEIDFVDQDDGNASFVFNNLPQVGGGCGNCGSHADGGGGCR